MSLWVRVESGQVVECVDSPRTGDNWFPTVEVRPTITPGHESYGAHWFDTSKNPVEVAG